jgi:DNA-binding XRE family transcriptional regulator
VCGSAKTHDRLGRAIRLYRGAADITQEAPADTADLDPTSIRGLERGIANPTWDVADRVARTLGLALHEPARRADELETIDRQPTNQPSRRHDRDCLGRPAAAAQHLAGAIWDEIAMIRDRQSLEQFSWESHAAYSSDR